MKARLGLRVDVDTLRGTAVGVPALLEALSEFHIQASFFFSVGPDNMGRNLYRLLRPAFFLKMLRSGAPSLYGWDILLKGTLWPGPIIGSKARAAIAAAAGHEIGLHAWDHFRWQNYLPRLRADEFGREFERAFRSLAEIVGREPAASANPAWRSTPDALRVKERYGFLYNSDCRGEEIFLPLQGGQPLRIPQIPVTLPTFDEVIGREGLTPAGYNRFILDRVRPDRLNVYTIHAEVEGGAYRGLFREFLASCRERGIEPVTLGSLLLDPGRNGHELLPRFAIEERPLPGREGKVAMPVAG